MALWLKWLFFLTAFYVYLLSLFLICFCCGPLAFHIVYLTFSALYPGCCANSFLFLVHHDSSYVAHSSQCAKTFSRVLWLPLAFSVFISYLVTDFFSRAIPPPFAQRACVRRADLFFSLSTSGRIAHHLCVVLTLLSTSIALGHLNLIALYVYALLVHTARTWHDAVGIGCTRE